MANAQPTGEPLRVDDGTFAPGERVDGEASPAPASPETTAARRGLSSATLFIVGIAVVAAIALFWPRHEGTPAPPANVVDASGRTVALGTQMRKVTLVHFFASWCPPCRPELPELVKLAGDMASERDLQVVLVAVEDQPQAAAALAGPTAAKNLLFDPKWDAAHRYGTSQLPETYLVVDGRVVRKFVGGVEWQDPQIRAALQAAIRRAES